MTKHTENTGVDNENGCPFLQHLTSANQTYDFDDVGVKHGDDGPVVRYPHRVDAVVVLQDAVVEQVAVHPPQDPIGPRRAPRLLRRVVNLKYAQTGE
jgi:hypothetical protein